MRKNMISRYVQTAVLALLPLAATGQNLDPTVEVSREYEGKLMEVHKPQLKMAVPDSALRFDLEFDYSVTDKPYKGSYEFSPYTVEMKPSPVLRDLNSFYMKAGAGYQLHPVFDLVWSPEFKSNAFRMNVYAAHRSFVGNYWDLSHPSGDGKDIMIDRLPKDRGGDRSSKGYDFRTRAGVDGRYDWEGGMLEFDVGYHGLQQEEYMADWVNRFYDALDVRAGVSSKRRTGLVYGLDVNYILSNDDVSVLHYGNDVGDGMDMKSSEYGLHASLGYVLRNSGSLIIDWSFDGAISLGEYDFRGNDMDLVPHYVKESGRWKLDLGARFSVASYSDREGVMKTNLPVYPDIRIELKAIKKALKLYFDLGGDSKLNSYSDLLAFNRFANPGYSHLSWNLMSVSTERLNVVIGAEGRIGPRFSFDLNGGYVNYADALMEGLYGETRLRPGMGYGSYNKLFASFDWTLDTESIRFDGKVEYAHSKLNKKADNRGLFLPAALTGDIAFTYDWKDRIFAGLDCEFSSSREGSSVYLAADYLESGNLESVSAKIPGYADLGFSAEFVMNRKFSVWARGGNLLGMTIQRNIMHAERGPYFTAGICLNL